MIKTSWRRLEDVFRLRLQKTSWRCLQKTSSRRLQDVLIKTNIFVLAIRLQRRLQDILKTYLQDVLEDKKLWRWRLAEDVSKTCLEDVFKTSWRPKNVCWAVSLSLGWVAMIQGFFNTCQWFFHFQYHQHSGQSKKISKLLFHLIMTFTEIFEFGKVKLSKSISSKDGVWREFLEIDSNTVRFQKMSTSKREFFYHFFQSVIITWLSQNKFTFHWYF